MLLIIAIAIFGLLAGCGAGLVLHKISRARTVRLAQEEAQEIVGEARENAELKALEEKERVLEIEMEMWTRVEPDMLKVETRVEELQELASERKAKVDAVIAEEKKKLQEHEGDIKKQETQLRQQEGEYSKIKDKQKSLNKDLVAKLTEKLNTSAEEFKAHLKKQMEEDTRKRSQNYLQDFETDLKEQAETRAKKILSLVIDRFARPYCAERGIGAVNFPDAHIRKLFCDPAGLNIKAVQETCGCDIIVEEGMDMVGVAGFDPVRRELTRRTLERVFKEKKNINPDFIRKIAENQKKELFKNIKHDGDALAKELRM